MVGEVLLRMLEGGFHHFPIAAADGSVLGVVTDTDLMGIGRDTPFALKSAIERAPDREAVATAVGELPRVVSTLVSASADPVDVGHVIAFAIDAATRRLLELGMAEHGEPPFPWAWLALGSAARQEQAIRTDQDHALAFEGDPDAAGASLAPLAEFVTAGLEAAGISRCTGNVMATNDALRLSLQQWVGRFEYWMNLESHKASEQLSIVFDFRRVAGALEADVALDTVMATAAPASALPPAPRPAALGSAAADRVRPRDHRRQRGEHPGKVDIKHGGIVIVGNLARAYAIRAGAHREAHDRTPRGHPSKPGRSTPRPARGSRRRSGSCGRSGSATTSTDRRRGTAGRLRGPEGARRASRARAEGGVPHHRARAEGARAGRRRRAPLAGPARVARGSRRRRPDRVVAAVDVHHLAGDPAREIREQEHDRVGDRRRVGRVPPERGPVAPSRRRATGTPGSPCRRSSGAGRRTRC
jgi:hypothetical protein